MMNDVYAYLMEMRDNKFGLGLDEILGLRSHRIVLNRDKLILLIFKLDGDDERLDNKEKSYLLSKFVELALIEVEEFGKIDNNEANEYLMYVASEFGFGGDLIE